MRSAEILIIGSELLTPRRHDSHSPYLIEKLTGTGIAVVFHATVGDSRSLIARAFQEGVARADLIIATGGLGPTADDLTREGLSDAFGLPLVLDSGLLGSLEARFAARGLPLPEVARKQALVPEGARLIPNRVGTAPGLWCAIVHGGRRLDVVVLPGPPDELRPMFEEQVLPRLSGLADGVFRSRILRIAGLVESAVEERVGSTYGSFDNPSTTVLASPGEIQLHLTAWGASGEEAERTCEELVARLRPLLGAHLVSDNGEEMEEVVGRLLRQRGHTVAVAESCTGGLILQRLTEVPGSSDYVDRGFVTYSNRSKTELLGVPPALIEARGAVSPEVAVAMAEGARDRAGSHYAVAVTGIAGPSGGSREKPVGLVYVGLAHRDRSWAERFWFSGSRSRIRWAASQAALNALRLELIAGGA